LHLSGSLPGRLERARLALMSDRAGLSIRDVARRHGFLQAGHFARLYRREFGELPSETLARRRG
jgi:transcriptional regulator GlxA family with amidase domain